MATHRLANFSRARDVLSCARRFYEGTSSDLDAIVADAPSERDRQFLLYASVLTCDVARELEVFCSEREDPALESWIQYTPEDEIPEAPSPLALRNAADAVRAVHDANERWIRVFDEMRRRTASGRVHALFGAASDLVTKTGRALSTASNQGPEG